MLDVSKRGTIAGEDSLNQARDGADNGVDADGNLFGVTMPVRFNDYQFLKDRPRYNTDLMRGNNKYEAVLAENIVQNISQQQPDIQPKPSKHFSIHPSSNSKMKKQYPNPHIPTLPSGQKTTAAQLQNSKQQLAHV